jgi:SAM-dependent methyltransferase
MTPDLGDSFQSDGAGTTYDACQYAPGSYWDIIWQLEKSMLTAEVDSVRARIPRIRHLDFACGTGRVLVALERLCDDSVGIDVSEEMLAVARRRVSSARLLCRDITAPGSDVEDTYEFITAFRFLLNASPVLRIRGLRALAARLSGPESVLIVNVHGSLRSYKALLAPFRSLKARFTGIRTERLLTPGSVRSLIEQAGLEVVHVHGMGILPGALLDRLPVRYRVGMELSLARWVGWLGVNQLFVCRLVERVPKADAGEGTK